MVRWAQTIRCHVDPLAEHGSGLQQPLSKIAPHLMASALRAQDRLQTVKEDTYCSRHGQVPSSMAT